MWGGSITREALLRSITLFHTLDKVPEQPLNNVDVSEVDSTYYLSIKADKEIAGNLAFLSAISDNVRQVMAVCIEEHPHKKGITIRLASNTGDLSEVTNGFKRIAQILERASARSAYRPSLA